MEMGQILHFKSSIRVTVLSLGGAIEHRYLELRYLEYLIRTHFESPYEVLPILPESNYLRKFPFLL